MHATRTLFHYALEDESLVFYRSKAKSFKIITRHIVQGDPNQIYNTLCDNVWSPCQIIQQDSSNGRPVTKENS